jgi:hypothetical protein
LFFPAVISNLAPVIFCKPVKDRKPVQKTEQKNLQQCPTLPDFVGKNTAREEMTYEMPGIGNVSGKRNIVVVWMTGNRITGHAKKRTK